MRSDPRSPRAPLPSSPPTSHEVVEGGAAWTPPIRLRSVLLVALLVGAGFWAKPRAIAAWKLHDAATALANYALCMVGPTGPSLLRDNPEEFRRLVRRRLVTSDAAERPFTNCAKDAHALTGDGDVERAHRATAWSFIEFGGVAADRAAGGHRGEIGLAALVVSSRPVAELAAAAWPFVRGGYTQLVKPSLSAKEATHPVSLASPVAGRGLPPWPAVYRGVHAVGRGHVVAIGQGANLAAFETRDGGLTWEPRSARHPDVADIAERCPAGDSRSFSFGRSDSGELWTVTSLGPDGSPHVVDLVPSSYDLVGASCDDQAVATLVKARDAADVTLHLCSYRRTCKAVPLPRFGGVGALPKYPMDVARLRGVTVVATVMHGIVRVASSRDDGRTWTPWSVAYDHGEHASVVPGSPPPSRLLAFADRVILYAGGATPKTPYAVLASMDHGASWRSR